jgi:hypothetical protein
LEGELALGGDGDLIGLTCSFVGLLGVERPFFVGLGVFDLLVEDSLLIEDDSRVAENDDLEIFTDSSEGGVGFLAGEDGMDLLGEGELLVDLTGDPEEDLDNDGLLLCCPDVFTGLFDVSFILINSSTSSLVTIPLATASSEGISSPVSGSVIRTTTDSTFESVDTSSSYSLAVSAVISPRLTASSKETSSLVPGTSTIKEDILVVVTPLCTTQA